MRPEDLEAAADIVNKVVRRYVRRQAPADTEDMQQQAWVVALETLQANRFDPAKATERGLKGYLWVAVNRKLGNHVSRWLSAVTLGTAAYDGHTARDTQRVRATLTAQGELRSKGEDERSWVPSGLVSPAGQEEALVAGSEHERQANWRIRWGRALDQVLAPFAPHEREVLIRMYGLDGDAPATETPPPPAGYLSTAPRCPFDDPGCCCVAMAGWSLRVGQMRRQFTTRMRQDPTMPALLAELAEEETDR